MTSYKCRKIILLSGEELTDKKFSFIDNFVCVSDLSGDKAPTFYNSAEITQFVDVIELSHKSMRIG